MTEKRQTSQGYIIRILQHFATKLRNITNFVMFFQAAMNFFVQTCLDQNFTQKGKALYTEAYLNVGTFDVGVRCFFEKSAMFVASPVKRGRLQYVNCACADTG
jgi:hypothetical protein